MPFVKSRCLYIFLLLQGLYLTMADEETGEYHAADAGASMTTPMQCGSLKKNGCAFHTFAKICFSSLIPLLLHLNWLWHKKPSHSPLRYVCIKGRPCKIVDYSTSKTGKHGHAKANIVGIDIFTQKKLEEMCPTSHNLDVPNVVRTEFSVCLCHSVDFFFSNQPFVSSFEFFWHFGSFLSYFLFHFTAHRYPARRVLHSDE